MQSSCHSGDVKIVCRISQVNINGCGHTRILSRYNLNCFTFFKFIFNVGKYGVITIATKIPGHTVPVVSFAKLPVLWLIFWHETSRHVIILVYHDWFILL